MSGKVFFIPLSFLLIVSFKQYVPEDPAYQSILKQFNHAVSLFNSPNADAVSDSSCLADFKQIIIKLGRFPRSVMSDSLLYQSYSKAGILSEVYNDLQAARSSYLNAIVYSGNPEQRFIMYVFAGAAYYKLNNFDSASYFLLQAERNISSINNPENRVRLYNSLGVLYYDNGNYLQSKNYFTQALHLIETAKRVDDLAVYSLRLNMATCYSKLGLYEQALNIYKDCLEYRQVKDPLYMNMARAYAGIHQYKQALSFFRKVNIATIPGVLNEMAKTALESGNPDSASAWLSQYRAWREFFHANALDDGVNELYSGDLAIFKNDPLSALGHLQKALIIFSKNFSNGNVRKNPGNFNGSFAYYRLFEVLVKKARAWQMMYEKNASPENLLSAFQTYQATISLLSYIERSYETDDAKLLLKKNSGQVYMDAVIASLTLDSLYPQEHWLDSAFIISEKNKASVMGSQIRENNFFLLSGRHDSLTAKERNIKFNIARLNSRADERLDAGSLQKINDEKSVYETQLVNLRREMEGDSRFYHFKYANDFPSVKQLQQNLHSGEALISVYNTPDKIELFVLTKSSLLHKELDSGESIRGNLTNWIRILQSAESGNHVQTKYLLDKIYKQFVMPLQSMAGGSETWIVIPDGIFFQLPFESLPENANGDLILERHTVSYEFSARFLIDNNPSTFIPAAGPLISFAPFSQKGADLKLEGLEWLQQLPFSVNETAFMSGNRLTDHQATKEKFIENLNRFPIVHLATHAMTDLENPSSSCIAFYPVSGRRQDNLLYLDEIYALRMDSCRLMVISACETGRGALVSNEGAMSFARAFLYAGCPSTINTLWKADDRATSEILRSFYLYLEQGESKSKALQKAKLDFLRNNPVDRNPSYWSHVILTGDPGPLYKKKQPLYWWAALVMSLGTIVLVTIRKKGKKSRRFS